MLDSFVISLQGDTVTYNADSNADHYTIHNLVKDGRYMIWIKAVSQAGVGPSSEVLYGVVVDKSKYSLPVYS